MKTLLCTYFTMYLEDKGLPSSDIAYSFAQDSATGMAFYGKLSDNALKSLAQCFLSYEDACLAIEAIDKGAYMKISDSSNGDVINSKHQPNNMSVIPCVDSSKVTGVTFASFIKLRSEVTKALHAIATMLSEHGKLIVETGQNQKSENSVRRMKETARSIMDTLAT